MFGTRPLFASPVHQGGPGKNVPQPPPNTPVQDQLSAGKKGVPVRYLRNVGAGRNVPVPVLLGGVTAFMAYGWWNYGTSVIADRSAFSPFCRWLPIPIRPAARARGGWARGAGFSRWLLRAGS